MSLPAVLKELDNKSELGHAHLTSDIYHQNSSVESILNTQTEKLNLLIGQINEGKTITITISDTLITDWEIIEGYWGNSYISTGG